MFSFMLLLSPRGVFLSARKKTETKRVFICVPASRGFFIKINFLWLSKGFEPIKPYSIGSKPKSKEKGERENNDKIR